MKLRLTILFLFFSFFSIAQTVNHVRIPKTGFYLIPPAGFEMAGFGGFQHTASGALITVTQIAGVSYMKLEEGMNARVLHERNTPLRSKRSVRVFNGEATLITVTENVEGVINCKQMLLFGDHHTSFLVTGICADTMQEMKAEIKESLLSTIQQPGSIADLLERARVKIQVPNSQFRLARYLAGDLYYTVDGRIPTQGPYLVTRNWVENFTIPFPKPYCLGLLRKLPYGPKLISREENEVQIGNLSGYEIVAEDTSQPGAMTYQVVLFQTVDQTAVFGKETRVYSFTGIALADPQNNLSRFRSISKSLRPGSAASGSLRHDIDTIGTYVDRAFVFPGVISDASRSNLSRFKSVSNSTRPGFLAAGDLPGGTDTISTYLDEYHRETVMEDASYFQQIWKDGSRLIMNTFFLNGEPEMISEFSGDSIQNGEGFFRRWYANGQLADSENYVHGALNGQQSWYFENGQKSEAGTYKDGLPENVVLWTKDGLVDTLGVANEKAAEFNNPEYRSLDDYYHKTIALPQFSVGRGQQAYSDIRFEITEKGKIRNPHVYESNGMVEWDNASFVAARGTRWKPAMSHNRPTRTLLTFRYIFFRSNNERF